MNVTVDVRKPCSSLFPLEHFVEMHAQASIIKCQELDLILLESLMTTIHGHEETVARGRHKRAKDKEFLVSCIMGTVHAWVFLHFWM